MQPTMSANDPKQTSADKRNWMRCGRFFLTSSTFPNKASSAAVAWRSVVLPATCFTRTVIFREAVLPKESPDVTRAGARGGEKKFET
jgi:hypothetical protein